MIKMMQYGETVHSILPQDVPWFLPDHAIFFGVFYAVLLVIGGGLGFVFMKSIRDCSKDCSGHH